MEEYCKEDREFLMVLDLPDDIKEQVGNDSLIIELDTREEKGWIEDVIMYSSTCTLHTTKKNWTEAEAECRSEGGHLASVISEEENQELKRVAGNKYVWLGGRKELGEWSWSDNFTWGFTDWKSGQSNEGDGTCVELYRGGWYDTACTKEYAFICQRKKTLMGRRKMNLTYTKDQLNFHSFSVYY